MDHSGLHADSALPHCRVRAAQLWTWLLAVRRAAGNSCLKAMLEPQGLELRGLECNGESYGKEHGT